MYDNYILSCIILIANGSAQKGLKQDKSTKPTMLQREPCSIHHEKYGILPQ